MGCYGGGVVRNGLLWWWCGENGGCYGGVMNVAMGGPRSFMQGVVRLMVVMMVC